MLEVLIQCGLFYAAWALFPRRTYFILYLVSLLNLLIYQLEAVSPVLQTLCAAVDTLTALAILRYGDVHKYYQVGILTVATVLNFLCELDASGTGNLVLADYTALMATLTGLQLLGAAYGLGTNKADRAAREHRP